MRDRRTLLWAAALAAAAVLAVCCAGRRPFRGLDPARIAWAQVRLTPPDRTLRIADVEELASLLREVVVYRRDGACRERSGRGVTFTLELTDGARREIVVCAPFLVVDGVGYRARYASCAALDGCADRLLRAEDAEVLLEEPPALTVTAGDTAQGAPLSGWSWVRRGAGGTAERSKGEIPPEELLSRLETLETEEEAVSLRFTERPGAVPDIRCWPRGQRLTGAGEALAAAGDDVPLRAGAYVYRVRARWTGAAGSGGTASYLFCVEHVPAS